MLCGLNTQNRGELKSERESALHRASKNKEDKVGEEASRLGVEIHDNSEGLGSRMWLGLHRHVQGQKEMRAVW